MLKNSLFQGFFKNHLQFKNNSRNSRNSRTAGHPEKDILILGKIPTQGFDHTTLTAEKEFTINFTEQHKKICLSLRYNGLNSCLFVNGVEIYKLKAKDSEIN